MHVSSLKPHCIAAIFAAVTLLGSGVSHATLDDSRHIGWYIAAGAGADWASLTKQLKGGGRDGKRVYIPDREGVLPRPQPAKSRPSRHLT